MGSVNEIAHLLVWLQLQIRDSGVELQKYRTYMQLQEQLQQGLTQLAGFFSTSICTPILVLFLPLYFS